MMSLEMERLQSRRQVLTKQLKEMSPQDPQYRMLWDERVDIILKIEELEKAEDV